MRQAGHSEEENQVNSRRNIFPGLFPAGNKFNIYREYTASGASREVFEENSLAGEEEEEQLCEWFNN